MEIEEIFADKSSIQITVMKVGNKSLSKSLINQFRTALPFDDNLDFIGDCMFGFVKFKKQADKPIPLIIIAQLDGEPIKFSWDLLHKLSYISEESHWGTMNQKASNFIKTAIGTEKYNLIEYKCKEMFYKDISELMDGKDLENLFKLRDKAKLYLDEI